jgi:3-oxoacyl-[acyl-carrier-protein] synthase II
MAALLGRRVVVTGMGAVTPVGIGVEATWAALLAGRSGAGPITAFDASGLPVRIAAEVDGFDGDERFGKRRARHLDRFVQLALVATTEAIESSGLDVASVGERTGVVYASGIGGIATLEQQILQMAEKGPSRVSPYMCPMMIPNMAAGEIAMEWNLLGPNTCTVTACAASAHAIGDAADMIRLGRADAMIAGGSEAAITPICIAGFTAMKALSERNDDPTGASRPFDRARDGFVSAEGAATIVLEARDVAVARGATILAELVGYGLTSDAHHITAPHPEGAGAIRAMRMALDQAEVDPSAVGYVNAHGTSTLPNDRVESLALRSVFGAGGPAVSSTKSMTGHLLGAAGALESIVSILALRDGLLPATINLTDPDPECDLDHVACTARERQVELVLSNSFGFGGHNGTLLFQRT